MSIRILLDETPRLPWRTLVEISPPLLPADIDKHPTRTRSHMPPVAAAADQRCAPLAVTRLRDNALAPSAQLFVTNFF